MCVFITADVLRETTSRGLCGLGCPSRTSERGGEGDCVKGGWGGEGKCERELHWSGYDTKALDIEVSVMVCLFLVGLFPTYGKASVSSFVHLLWLLLRSRRGGSCDNVNRCTLYPELQRTLNDYRLCAIFLARLSD
jgi:hypothetical protein